MKELAGGNFVHYTDSNGRYVFNKVKNFEDRGVGKNKDYLKDVYIQRDSTGNIHIEGKLLDKEDLEDGLFKHLEYVTKHYSGGLFDKFSVPIDKREETEFYIDNLNILNKQKIKDVVFGHEINYTFLKFFGEHHYKISHYYTRRTFLISSEESIDFKTIISEPYLINNL